MEKLLNEFTSIIEKPYESLRKWKSQTGKKIIGCFPMYVPEELIHAAGMLPVTLLGNDEPISLAHQYLQPYICHPVRSNLELALKGELEFLDGIVFPDICDSIACLADIWQRHLPLPFHHSILLPERLDLPISRQYLIKEFARFKKILEEFSGVEIPEQSLQHSIAIHNYNRKLLNQLYNLKQNNPSLLKSRDVVAITSASMFVPKEEHNKLLETLLKHTTTARHKLNEGIRLVISGNLCDSPELWLLDMIDELGALIIDDDLYIGRRYFATQADNSLSPIEALADRYIRDIPCSTKYNPDNDLADGILNMVKRSRADGVLIVMIKYCEPHGFDYPYIKKRMSEAGIPHLLLETEHTGKSQAVRTRLQAFLEMIRK